MAWIIVTTMGGRTTQTTLLQEWSAWQGGRAGRASPGAQAEPPGLLARALRVARCP